jgi:hypothetical protein
LRYKDGRLFHLLSYQLDSSLQLWEFDQKAHQDGVQALLWLRLRRRRMRLLYLHGDVKYAGPEPVTFGGFGSRDDLR